MTVADRIARAFVEVRSRLASGYSLDVAGWDELDEWSRRFHVSVFEAMLERRDIDEGRRWSSRDSLPLPAEVSRDVRDIRRFAHALEILYARAYDDLEGSGQSYEAGGRRVGDLNPTLDHTIEKRRRGERADVGRAGRAVADARNGLSSAREALARLVVERGYGQEERDRVRPDRQALVSPEALREAIDAQDARARGEKS